MKKAGKLMKTFSIGILSTGHTVGFLRNSKRNSTNLGFGRNFKIKIEQIYQLLQKKVKSL